MQILVVDIGGTWIKYACMTENMDILNRGKVKTPQSGREELIETIGKNTLSIYLLHTIVILILMYTPINDWIFNKIGWQLLISVGLTLGLSWNGFERLLRKIAIPYYGNRKK